MLRNSLHSVSKSTHDHFLRIDRTQKDELIKSSGQRDRIRRTSRDERRSSIFKSLHVLDVDENDADYTSIPISTLRSNSSSNSESSSNSNRNYYPQQEQLDQQPHQSQKRSESLNRPPTTSSASTNARHSRYLRRGSVTKHKLEADSMGMQPTSRRSILGYNNGGQDDCAVGGDESDYGSDYDSAVSDSEQKSQRRYLRRGSVTKYSLDSSVGVEMQPTSVAQDHVTMQTLRGNHKSRLPPPPSNDSYTKFDWKYEEYNDTVDDDDAATDDGKKVDDSDGHKETSSMVIPSSSSTRRSSMVKSGPKKDSAIPSTSSSHSRRSSMSESSNPKSTCIKAGQQTQDQQQVRNAKPAPRPTRRGSMKMPDSYQHPPTPSMKYQTNANNTARSTAEMLGDDYYSGNLDDSGHRSRNIYFEPEDVMHLVAQQGDNAADENDDGHLSNSAAGMVGSRSVSLSEGKVHGQRQHKRQQTKKMLDDAFDHDVIPLFVRKTSSGRSLLVDESDQYRLEDGNFHDADTDSRLETINGNGWSGRNRTRQPQYHDTVGLSHQQMHTLQRRGSNSSVESSENSDAEFGSDQHPYHQHNTGSDTKMTPRLPPTYSTPVSSSTYNATSPQKKISIRGNGDDKKIEAQKYSQSKPPPSPEDKLAQSVALDTDSTTSSTRSEEEDSVISAIENNLKVDQKKPPVAALPLQQPNGSSQSTIRLSSTKLGSRDCKKQSFASSGTPLSPSRRSMTGSVSRSGVADQPQQSVCKPPARQSSITKNKNAAVEFPPLSGKARSNKTKHQNGIIKSCLIHAQNFTDQRQKHYGSDTTLSLKSLSSSSNHSSASTRVSTKRVRFGRIVITEFPIILGKCGTS
jgi:hypothetical protein